MNPSSRLRNETGAELAAQQASAANRQFTVTFEAPEELLRYDRQQTPPPAALATRLEASLAGRPAPAAPSWWKRLLKRR
ncbi:MAG: hypothetical protein KF791_01585 [Verrucomicrobiae bacterium]|nr:hypothetical protein [Verrucomicrobiae bacterium]